MKIHSSAAIALLQMSLHMGSVFSLPQYAQRIPNGHSVPNPGPQGGVWAGVGHVNAGGGGENNQFGRDFAANGHEWTEALCKLDSDGDGRSNGEELGDPDCLWSQGMEPAGPAVSHPGIDDEPVGAVSNHCDTYVPPADEMTWDIAFSAPASMDETQTHYICEQKMMDVPIQALVHKIKHGIIMDNSNVLHHMFVYLCPAGQVSTDGDRVGQGSYQCSGNESGCMRVGGWAVGPEENCEPPNVGMELDFTESNQMVVKIEAHYDNTSGQPQQDQSGIRLTMTPTLRPLSGTGTMAGMSATDTNFVIPAGESGYPLTGLCPTAITEYLEKPVYIYSFTPHMHYYGKTMVTEHYRCGHKIGEIGHIADYEFDNQQTYTLDPPVKILPGDSLVTTCGFDTTSVDQEIRGGEETNDEMCINFLNMYPHPGTETNPNLFNFCMTWENGLSWKGQAIERRFAAGDRNQGLMLDDFESDPLANIGSCCAANNCEELYLADDGEACGVSDDCKDNLVCDGGLCASEGRDPTDDANVDEDEGEELPPLPEPSEETSGAVALRNLGYYSVGVIALLGLLSPL